MDFFRVKQKDAGKNRIEIYPDFSVGKSKDLMIRGKSFYAIWDEEKGLWSTDEYDVQRLVDKELQKYYDEHRNSWNCAVHVRWMSSYSSSSWKEFKKYVQALSDNYKQLDTKIIFSNTEVTRSDFASMKLPYPLKKCSIKSYNELMDTLYSEDERRKIEWAIGSIIAGDSKNIQKFLVFYGEPGTGKSTVLNIIQDLFTGYYTTFEAKSLTQSSNMFATEAFKSNPLIAIQHDGDLSKIEDNSKLNSIISHEEIMINEKYKSAYPMRVNCMLFMGTNKPVKITDAKAGIIRRLIDVRPTGNKVEPSRYLELKEQIQYELSGIAYHCLNLYNEMGKNYYNKYKPVDMMYKTDPFFNFVESYQEEFTRDGGVTLKSAYSMYKQYCDDSSYNFKMPMYVFREELKNYFKDYKDYIRLSDGTQLRSYYYGFRFDKMKRIEDFKPIKMNNWIKLTEQKSILDEELADCYAQYANDKETPSKKWENVKTYLADIDTTKLHYIRVPENHIVIDFDLKDENGEKSLEKNLEAAKSFPKTYAETSKSGNGLHLHYIYDGDVNTLSRVYDDNIEVKVFTGNSSLRRKLVKCNDIPIATINCGLPLREVKDSDMVNFETIKSEKLLRVMIKKNLNKEYHANTKPSIDFINKLLTDAYNSGMKYDVSDLQNAVIVFASNSHNQADACLKIVNKMHFKSDEPSEVLDWGDSPLVVYDVEVFPNLFVIDWKKIGDDTSIIKMINPTPKEVEALLKFKLIGHNCRRYDNHILHARMMGYTNEQLFNLSQKIINTKKGEKSTGFFGEAYNYSYTDTLDYPTTKQSLKKWEIELKDEWNKNHPDLLIKHHELGLAWDQPVPEELWDEVAEYCKSDVFATEAVWESTQADFKAREILVAIAKHSGTNSCVNDTTNTLTTRIIFGNDRHPQLIYTDLKTGKSYYPDGVEYEVKNDFIKAFPDYELVKDENGKYQNMFMGEDVGFGGYVYAEPGVYTDVALLDIASMHPHSILAMDCFGEYTDRFRDLVNARIAIKHKDWDTAKSMLDGAFSEYLDDEKQAKALSTALKIPINSVYGLTSAKFDNPFRDVRNVNNIVALRGALFMVTLKHEIIKRGFTPFHFKTDSVKIANATPEIIQFCMEFARKYGYEFEHEATYSKICIVNGSTYIAKYSNDDINGDHKGEWTATAAQFQQPYVFKTLFSHEPITFKDMCEIKEVKGALYLDLNEGLGEDEHNYHFVGKVGEFCPMQPGCGAGELLRFADDKYSAAVGTKGYRWLESDMVKSEGIEDMIDKSYYTKLVDAAVKDISKYCDFEWFVAND